MNRMWCAAAALVISLAVNGEGLRDVKSVYLLPMSNGLDQYLAEQLASHSVLQVVTDPHRADAVLTDHVGDAFESTLAELYTVRLQPGEKSADQAEDKGAPFARSGMQGRRGRGTVFLVDRKTHDVLWSVYQLPKDTRPDALRRTANKISVKLAQSIKGK